MIKNKKDVKRVLNLGKWRDGNDRGGRGSRPVFVEFANHRYKSRFLAAAKQIKTITGREITPKPDSNAV